MRLASRFITVLCCSLIFTCVIEAQTRTKSRRPARITPATPPVQYFTSDKPRPFSDAVRVGQLLYLTGQLGTDSSGALVSGGIKAETKQTMENIGRLLERTGSSFDQVVKCTVMLADMSEWGAMNEVYVTYFAKDRLPARSAFGVNGLARSARVEIECVATIK